MNTAMSSTQAGDHAWPPAGPCFALGQICASAGIAARFQAGALSLSYLHQCLRRHASGDWGDVDATDAALNDAALCMGDRLLSVYPLDPAQPEQGTLWILTEADRSVTTVLLPDEY